MSAEEIAFGRMVRFTCDIISCEERHTTTGEPPDGWEYFASTRTWACPKHVADADFDRLCEEMG